MTLPNEDQVKAALQKQFDPLFKKANRVHSAAVEVLTRGHFNISNPDPHCPGTLTVVASLISKACKTFRAIQVTCAHGLGQDAAVLGRQLFETTVAITFVLQKDQRVRCAMLAAYEDQRRLVQLRDASTAESMKHLASSQVLASAQGRVDEWLPILGETVLASVKQHWSGRSLQWAAEQVGLREAYIGLFRSTSAFAHVGDLGRQFSMTLEDPVPTLKLAPSDEFIERVLQSCLRLLSSIVSEANGSFGLEEDEVVARIEAELHPL